MTTSTVTAGALTFTTEILTPGELTLELLAPLAARIHERADRLRPARTGWMAHRRLAA